jgi:hypothetical protein
MSQNSADEFNRLAIHDCDIENISAAQMIKGDWKLTVTLSIDSIGRQLVFENCRAISTNIHGGMAIGDVVDKYHATRDSEIFRNADKWPSPLSGKAQHYSITTSSGSRLDVVAESFELGG